MEQYFIFIIIFIVALLIGGFIGKLLSRVTFEKEKSSLQERNTILTETKVNAERTISGLQLEYKQLQRRKKTHLKGCGINLLLAKLLILKN